MDEEIWRSIDGFPGYEVSNLGRVRSFYRHGNGDIVDTPQRILKPSLSNGYYGINLRKNSITYYKRIHYLVAFMFLGECPNGFEICHNNGDKLDNRASNLRYDTHEENIKDAFRHGVFPVGEKGYRAAFSNAEVRRMRLAFKRGVSVQELSICFGAGTPIIRNALRGKTYKNASGPIFDTTQITLHKKIIRKRLSLREKRKIKAEMIKEYESGNVTYRDLAEKYDYHYSSIANIINGKQWVDV
jgi:hypothetical protein